MYRISETPWKTIHIANDLRILWHELWRKNSQVSSLVRIVLIKAQVFDSVFCHHHWGNNNAQPSTSQQAKDIYVSAFCLLRCCGLWFVIAQMAMRENAIESLASYKTVLTQLEILRIEIALLAYTVTGFFQFPLLFPTAAGQMFLCKEGLSLIPFIRCVVLCRRHYRFR